MVEEAEVVGGCCVFIVVIHFWFLDLGTMCLLVEILCTADVWADKLLISRK